MRKWWLAGLAGMVLTASSAAADVLDDLGIDAATCAGALHYQSFDSPQTRGAKLLGLPVSDGHAAEIAAELAKLSAQTAYSNFQWKGDPTEMSRRLLVEFYEQLGDLETALTFAAGGSVERIRLLVRLGRREEALKEAAGGDFQRFELPWDLHAVFHQACQPLEDAEKWDQLVDFLAMLRESATDPKWKREIWAEELDVAWHRDRLPELLRGAAGDPARLAVFHWRLGNEAKCERLVEVFSNLAEPAQVAELAWLLPDSPAVRAACMALWEREDLASAERPVLLRSLFRLPRKTEMLERVRAWVARGDDPLPMVDVLWDELARPHLATPDATAVLAAVHNRIPQDPRVGLLLARAIMKSDPAKAAELFEALAKLPLASSREVRKRGRSFHLDPLLAADPASLAVYGIVGLGMLNRQDRVEAVLRARQDWDDLTSADRVRYLAAGSMDREMVAEILAADFSKSENESIATELLRTSSDWQFSGRSMPREVAVALAGKWPAMAAGSVEKKPTAIVGDAVVLLGLLGGRDVPVEIWREGFATLRTRFGALHPDDLPMLETQLFWAARKFPRLTGLASLPAVPWTRPAREIWDYEGASQAAVMLRLFLPPEIRRVMPTRDSASGMFQINPRLDLRDPNALPLRLLGRWSYLFDSPFPRNLIPFFDHRPPTEADFAKLRAMFDHFPPGHPRRIAADLLIADGQLACGGGEIEKSAKVTAAALIAGETEARGTEAFRFILSARSKEPEAVARREKILEELKLQPPSRREQFLLTIQAVAKDDRGPFAKACLEAATEAARTIALPKRPNSVPPVAGPRSESPMTKAQNAIKAGDRAALSAAIRSMGPETISAFANPLILEAFGKDGAADVLKIVLGSSGSEGAKWLDETYRLHEYFLKSDPALAADFRAGLLGHPQQAESLRRHIASQLLAAGFRKNAVEFFAATLQVPTDYPGFPHQFPPGDGTGRPPAVPDADLKFLKESGLMADVLALLQPPAPVDPVVLATLRLTASPELVTLERDVLPAMADMGDTTRREAFQTWVYLAKDRQAPPDLQLRLLREWAAAAGWRWRQVQGQALAEASGLPGGERLVSDCWAEILRESDGGKMEKNSMRGQLPNLLIPMARGADDATWASYWEQCRTGFEPEGMERLLQNGPPVAFVDPARLRQFLPLMLTGVKSDLKDYRPRAWTFAAAASGDAEIMAKVRAKLPAELGESAAVAKLFALAQGDPAAISPVLLAGPAAGGGTRLAWQLVTMDHSGSDGADLDIPCFPFPALDGKVRIQLVAGPTPDWLKIVKTIPLAPAAGEALVKLSRNQRFVAMIATDPETGTVHGTEAWEVPAETGSAVTEEGMVRRGAGPFGQAAWSPAGTESIKICTVPWRGTSAYLEGWIMGSGYLQIACVNEDGREWKSLMLADSSTGDPVWRRFSIPDDWKVPAATARVFIIVRGRNPDFAISGVRLRREPPPALPDGFERLGRAPVPSGYFVVSPDASQAAFIMGSGELGLVRLADGLVTNLPPPAERGLVAGLVWGKTGFYAAAADGSLLRIELQTGATETVIEFWDPGKRPSIPSLALSPDGAWVAWQEGPRRLRLASLDNKVRRTFERNADFRFEFGAAGLRILGKDGVNALLPTAGFLVGKPASAPADIPDYVFKGETAPKGFHGRKLPILRSAAAIGADGSVVFVEEIGNFVRVRE